MQDSLSTVKGRNTLLMERLTAHSTGHLTAPLNSSAKQEMIPRDSVADRGSMEERERDLTMRVFTISAGMVGVCLTGIGLLRVVVSQTQAATIGDDLLAADAVLLMICCTLSFWSFKTKQGARRRVMRWVMDAIFMMVLALMVVVCGLIAYAIG